MYRTPESAGIPSPLIREYLASLEEAGLSTHAILIARGSDILFEKYYPPFHPDFLHREYSDTKSLVAIAIGFAEQDGLLSLDDPISKYFADELVGQDDPRMGDQTVRQMLMMSTPKAEPNWFRARTKDRVRYYFEAFKTTAECGSRFYYDSTGSFVLGALVERLTGKTFFEYLREKLFDRLGVSREAHCLLSPGGHAWSDSASLMKPRDMMRVIRFLLDGGRIGGEQVLNERFVREATSNLIGTESEPDAFEAQGYGYLIWRTYENSFFFNGMGCQFAVGMPEKDLIFIINSDNQGIPHAGQTVIGNFFRIVYPGVGEPLPEDAEGQAALAAYAESLSLASQKGEAHSPREESLGTLRYTLGENPMGIRWLAFDFGRESGLLRYENATGEKCLPFGLCRNVFTLFPEEGYSREVGSVAARGNHYRTASSGAWRGESTLVLNVQVIDEYFGRLWMEFTFDGDCIRVKMTKCAEDFFDEYVGEAVGKAESVGGGK